MSDETIKGEVRNGERVAVAFPWFTGMAGVQQTDQGVQVAYFSRASAKAPGAGTVGGRPFEVLTAERSRTVEGAIVLTGKFVGEQA
ncbi:hypothetical protein [Sphingomonas leidyi]|uniref:hypothetical protein n=1 Tax=Sphingomonas leidyi TaxID=68569 RepID=UPI0036D3C258